MCWHAQEEEFYVITWEAKKEEIFEMPTGGAAIANKGPNLLKLARKEQCLALLAQLRSKFKTDGVIYRSAKYRRSQDQLLELTSMHTICTRSAVVNFALETAMLCGQSPVLFL